jgi:phospholipid/cholesterol/gamma-HCH transport system substrate-binding protein
MRRERGMSKAKAGALTIVIAGVGTFFGFTKSNPLADPYEVRAAFSNAAMVKKGAKVRIAGVDVGVVSKVDGLGDRRGGAMVTMEIKEEGLPIHRDAQVKVRPRIFLEGNYFVDLSPGSPSAPAIEDGGVIPVGQTAAPVGIGQVLETFQQDTRESLRTVLQELGRGLDRGGAEGLNGAISWWPRAFRDSAIVGEAARGETGRDLSGYVEGAGAVAQALDRDPEALKSLITDFATTADALADQQDSLRRGIGLLDDTLLVGRDALGDLNGALPQLARLARELRPAARAARPALDAQLPLVRQLRALVADDELRGLVRDLRPVVPDLVRLTTGTTRLQEQTRLLSSCQANNVLPITESTIQDPEIPAQGKVYEEGLRALPGLAGESRSFDANGQYTKTLVQSANFAYALPRGQFFFTGRPLVSINPPKAARQPAYRNDVPCETQDKPDLRTRPQTPPTPTRLDHTTAASRARQRTAITRAVRALRRDLRIAGLDKRLKVTSTPVGR